MGAQYTLPPAAERALAESGDDLVSALQALQEVEGYLAPEALLALAERLDLSVAHIFGVATFYERFRRTPRGDRLVQVCHGTACHVLGAERITERLADHLGVAAGGTTSDRQFTLENVACVGCCSLAPVVVVDDAVHGRLVPTQAMALLTVEDEPA